MPGGREKPLHLQSTTDLWVGIFGIPAFGSFFLAVPLMGTPVDRSWSWWNTLGLELFFIGFLALGGMTTLHAPPGGVVALELEHVEEFARQCPAQYAAVVECAAFVNWRRIEVGQPAVLALSFFKRA